MKIIFLDIDGVLNSFKYDLHRSEHDGNIDKTRLPILKRVIDATGALIVLSSSWRKHWENEDNFDPIGAEIDAVFESLELYIYDKTPILSSASRKQEIEQWLLSHKDEVEAFVIIDDIFGGWDELSPYVIKTSAYVGYGLMDCHAEKAIEILNRTD